MVPGSPSTRGALATAMNDPSMHPSIDFVRWFEIIYIYIYNPPKNQRFHRWFIDTNKFSWERPRYHQRPGKWRGQQSWQKSSWISTELHWTLSCMAAEFVMSTFRGEISAKTTKRKLMISKHIDKKTTFGSELIVFEMLYFLILWFQKWAWFFFRKIQDLPINSKHPKTLRSRVYPKEMIQWEPQGLENGEKHQVTNGTTPWLFLT